MLSAVKTYALIVAAGRAVRFGGAVPKQFREVCGRPLLSWTISRFEQAASIDAIAVVVAEEHLLYTSQKVVDPYGFTKVRKIVVGGETRRESVLRGLKAIPISTRVVAIHDGARPLTKSSDIDRVVKTAQAERAAMLAIPATDTVKRVREGYVLGTLERDSLYLAQTPQVFDFDLILEAHQKAGADVAASDDASLVEARGFKVRIVEPSAPNVKVTNADDLAIVEALLKQEAM
ncbi:2-C-methyl-D-erythritol 4-phosphate cytidylyltransferase [candidate division GN15 bacterium]|uniref:2-C-methyl-D-erythritol 4-phosphate cytidylyltransferase n=1 Tax=candidate division GN15 bacterium TaxID=2072418 RepID=A0A855X2H8_9BACT|nr:MAG: 2-C-methyl-D-erythritol 4-phosphate cytidylyltransferase [candidate division GN15 bacterium]